MTQFLGLVLALAPSYLVRFHIFGIPTTLLEILIAVFLVATGLRLKIKDLSQLKNLGKINYAIGLFVLAGIISTIISPNHREALGQLKAFIIEPVLVFYAINLLRITDYGLRIILRWLFWATVIISLFGILQYYSFINLPIRFWGNGGEIERITSFFDYPNALALYLAPLFGLFFTLFVFDYRLFKNKWVEWAGMGIVGLALLMTFSRGAWIAVAISLLWVLAKRFGFKKTSIAAACLIILIAVIPSTRHRISLGLSDPSSEAHGSLINFGFQKALEHPLLGTGLAGFAVFNQGVNYPHNIVLNFWLETGILGMISFAWIIFLVFRQYKKSAFAKASADKQPLLLAACVYLVIFLIHGLVDVPYFKNDLALLFWFVISIFYLV
jgi:O-antigen ligase